MHKFLNYFSWVLFIVGGAILFFVTFPLSLIYPSLDWTLSAAIESWDDWQTLVAGTVALLASVIAYKSIQIRAKQEKEQNFAAARAQMPALLADINDYCRDLYKRTLAIMDKPEDASKIVQQHRQRNQGRYEKIIERIGQIIQHGDQDIYKHFAKITTLMQIQESRFRSLENAQGINVPLYDIALFYFFIICLTGDAFAFARGETKQLLTTQPTKEKILNKVEFEEQLLQKHKDGLEEHVENNYDGFVRRYFSTKEKS